MRIDSCSALDCRVPSLKAWAGVAAWDGREYFQLGCCATNTKSLSQQDQSNPQVTATYTLVGLCNPGVLYGAMGKGYAYDHSVYNYLPDNPPGSFGFVPRGGGGVDLC